MQELYSTMRKNIFPYSLDLIISNSFEFLSKQYSCISLKSCVNRQYVAFL